MGSKQSKTRNKTHSEDQRKIRAKMTQAAKQRVEDALGGASAGAGAGARTGGDNTLVLYRGGEGAARASALCQAQLSREGKCLTKADLVAVVAHFSTLRGRQYTESDLETLADMTCASLCTVIRTNIYASQEALRGMATAAAAVSVVEPLPAPATGTCVGTGGNSASNSAAAATSEALVVPVPSAPPAPRRDAKVAS